MAAIDRRDVVLIRHGLHPEVLDDVIVERSFEEPRQLRERAADQLVRVGLRSCFVLSP